MNDKGPLLVFRHTNSDPAVIVSSDNYRKSSIGIYAGKDQVRLFLSHLPDKGPSLGLFDNENRVKAFLAVNNGDPSITLADRDKKPAIAMFNKRGRGSYLSIWNSNDDPAVSLAVQGDKPGLFMYQQPRTGLLFNMAGGRPALALMDHGSPIWSATGVVPPAPELPPMDDMMRELTRQLSGQPKRQGPGENLGAFVVYVRSLQSPPVGFADHGIPGVFPDVLHLVHVTPEPSDHRAAQGLAGKALHLLVGVVQGPGHLRGRALDELVELTPCDLPDAVELFLQSINKFEHFSCNALPVYEMRLQINSKSQCTACSCSHGMSSSKFGDIYPYSYSLAK
eukprot:TRINITY_DN3867_c0_g1_i1.p1 TRINITY_DN3867_c0_g1~~TRINITY_DN3867_c0_g1_i1.p1  ORF type:complete len:371 (+),score=47.92 TRINITY_DN3867_c0_g1_i1:103-1113(+)